MNAVVERLRDVSFVVLAIGCSSVDTAPSPARVTPPSVAAPLAAVQPPTLYGLDVVKKWDTEDPPSVFSGDGEEWRQQERYRKYERVIEVTPALTTSRFLDTIVRLMEEARTSDVFQAGAGNGPPIRDKLLLQLSSLLDRLGPDRGRSLWASIQNRTDVGAALWQSGAPARPPAGWRYDVYFGHDGNSTLTLFAETDQDEFLAYATEDQAIEFRAVVDLVGRMLDRVRPVGEAMANLERNDRAWENYLRRGYSQYPWENLVNDWLVPSAWDEPPESQWIFLHPEMGVLVDVRSSESSDFDGALLVHGLGYLRYFKEERSWFFGASLTGSISTDEDNGLGFGGTVHFGATSTKRQIPHVSLGLLWQDTSDRSDGFFVSLGVDAFRLFSDPDVNAARASASQ